MDKVGVTDEEQIIIFKNKDKFTISEVDTIEGEILAKTLEYLSKELIRIYDEHNLNAFRYDV